MIKPVLLQAPSLSYKDVIDVETGDKPELGQRGVDNHTAMHAGSLIRHSG